MYSMPVLRRKLNHRNILLFETPSRESIGVAMRTGDYRYIRWLGFVDVEQAKAIPGAKPVKLLVEAISPTDGYSSDWQSLSSGQHVQGCLVPAGVYGILEQGQPRVLASH